MGRPKKLSFSCSYCGKEFIRKINLKKHLLCHPNLTSNTRVARARSNWCHVCRRSFSDTEYKRHIENEHKFDNYKIPSGNTDDENECKPIDSALNLEYNTENLLADEGKFFIDTATNSKGGSEMIPAILKKRDRKPGKIFQNVSLSTNIKIKSEPPDTYETSVNVFQSKNVSSNSSYMTCKMCGFKSKTVRGIKIHLSTIHKRKNNSSVQKTSKTALLIKQEPLDEDSDQVKNTMKIPNESKPLFTSDSVSNADQNVQTGVIYNSIQNHHPFNNFIGYANQLNVQNALSIVNQQVETIPMFNYDSEKYIKWLKKFISRCKMQKYPLTPMLCQSVSHINEEITNALASPEGSLKKKSNHFYFMRIKSLLSEIMAGQLRYSMSVVIK